MNTGIWLKQLSINQSGVMGVLRNYFQSALREAEPILIDNMKREMKARTHGDAPGKPSWATELSALLQETYVLAVDNFIELGVGIPSSVATNIIVRAMIIEDGSGSKVGNPKIKAGPSGRSVWDDDVTSQHPSNAKSEYFLPEEFNQEGNHFIENAIKLTEKHFDDVLTRAARNLPASQFYQSVISK